MPRLKEDTRLLTFRLSPRLYERYAEAVKQDEQTMSADLRRYVASKVKRTEQRKAA